MLKKVKDDSVDGRINEVPENKGLLNLVMSSNLSYPSCNKCMEYYSNCCNSIIGILVSYLEIPEFHGMVFEYDKINNEYYRRTVIVSFGGLEKARESLKSFMV